MRSQNKTDHDKRYMLAALELAKRGLGNAWPNPSVGCILVKNFTKKNKSEIIGRGWTQPGGRPHAEIVALKQANYKTLNTIAFVTLEPCCHIGKTSPCIKEIIRSGISKVVVACRDPDPRVSGRGLLQLKNAGIEVVYGVCKKEAEKLNEGFFKKIKIGRPMITVKVATTIDGCIATRSGDSKWITGDLSRQQGHLLRAKHDAVLVGVGTVIKDDPSLTCRLPGMKRFSPIRIIIDTALRTPLSSQLVRTSRSYPTWIFTNKIETSSRVKVFRKNGVHVISLANQKTKNKVPLKTVMKKLAQEGITRVLVEGGSKVITSFMREQLVDHLVLFRSTKIIGSNGLTVAGNLKIERLLNAISFNRTSIRESGEDVVESYER